MALKKILEFEVDPDGKLKAFQADYSKFVGSIGKLPNAIANAIKPLKELGAGWAKVHGTAASTVDVLDRHVGVVRRISSETKGIDFSWKSVARSSAVVSSNIKGATSNLLRWAGASAIMAGSFGLATLGMDRLAASVGASRRYSTGIGTSIGESAAFKTTFGRIVDPGAFLGGVAQGKGDVGSQQFGALAALGVGRGGGVASTAMDALQKIYDLAHRTDDALLGTMAKAFGLEAFGVGGEEMRRFKGMSPEEFARYKGDYTKLSGQANVSDSDARAFQDFGVKLNAAGDKIWATFVKGLEPLTQPLSDLVEAFSDLVRSILGSDGMRQAIEWVTAGFKDFAAYVNTPGFKQDVKELVDNFAALAKSTAGFLQFLAKIPGFATQVITAPLGGVGPSGVSWWSKILGGSSSGSGSVWDRLFGRSKSSGVRTLPDGTIISDDPAVSSGANFPGVKAPGNNLFGMRPIGSSTGFQNYGSHADSVMSASNNLLYYRNKLGLDTLQKIISTWAPSNENNTSKYIQDMVGWTGYGANQKIDLNDPTTRSTVLAGIARKEQGNIISPQQIKVIIENNTGGSVNASTAQAAPTGFPQ